MLKDRINSKPQIVRKRLKSFALINIIRFIPRKNQPLKQQLTSKLERK